MLRGVGTIVRYTLAMSMLVGAAWVATTWDVGGRTPVEHFAEHARMWLGRAADAAKARGRALLDEAWDRAADAFMGRDDSPAAKHADERNAEPAPSAPPVEPRARERVSALDRARRALPAARGSAEGAPPPPDRPPSAEQRRALERKLAE